MLRQALAKHRRSHDERGAPLSLIVAGANRHDVSQLESVLGKIMVRRPNPPLRRSKHLRVDAGHTGAKALAAIQIEGYIAHVVGRAQEATVLKQKPGTKARR